MSAEFENLTIIGTPKEAVGLVIETHLISCLLERFKHEQRLQVDIRETFPNIYAPSTLINILINLGWIRGSIDPNGWDGATEVNLSNEAYSFDLMVYYNGYYGDLVLQRVDIDDEDKEADINDSSNI